MISNLRCYSVSFLKRQIETSFTLPSKLYCSLVNSKNISGEIINYNIQRTSFAGNETSKLKNNAISEKNLVFDKNSADIFGNLNNDRVTRKKLESIDEEGDVEECNFIDDIEGKRRLKPEHYAAIIKGLLNDNKLQEALDILEVRMLQQDRAKPDLYIYNLLISGCARVGGSKKAFQLFNQMKKRGVKPRLSTYTSLFNAYANSGQRQDSLRGAAHLRELMLEKGIQPNLALYHASIKAFGRHGDLRTSFSLVDEMMAAQIQPTSVTFNFLLQAAASDKKEGFRHALLLWRKMMEKKILPTSYTFNLMLRCVRDCAIGKDLSFLQSLQPSSTSPHQQMEGGGQVTLELAGEECREVVPRPLPSDQLPNLLTPIASLGSLLSIDKPIIKPWHRLLLLGDLNGFLNTMDAAESKPDIKTFTLLVEIIKPSKDHEEELLNEMRNRKIKIDVSFCNLLMKKRNNSARYEDGRAVLDLMALEKVRPDIMTFGVLALGCNTKEEAKQLIRDLETVGFRCNVEMLGGLASRACHNLSLEMGCYILHCLEEMQLRPEPRILGHLIRLRDILHKYILAKENGEVEYHSRVVDNKDFQENYSKFVSRLSKLEKQLEDLNNVQRSKFRNAVR